MTSENKPVRLSTLARELNVGTSTIIEFLAKKGYEIEGGPNSKLPFECIELLEEEFKESKTLKEKAIKNTEKARETKEMNISLDKQAKSSESLTQETEEEEEEVLNEETTIVEPEVVASAESEEKSKAKEDSTEQESEKPLRAKHEVKPIEVSEDSTNETGPKVLGTIDLDQINQKTRPKKKTKAEREEERKQKEEELRSQKEAAKKKKEAEIKKKKAESDQAQKKSKPTTETKKKTKKDEEKVVEKPRVFKALTESDESQQAEFIKTKIEKLSGPSVVGKIDIDGYLTRQEEAEKRKKQEKEERQKTREKEKEERKAKRKRIQKVKVNIDENLKTSDGKRKKINKKKLKPARPTVDQEDVQKQIKETLARLTTPKQKSRTSKYRREKRDLVSQKRQEEFEKQEAEKSVLKVTEFVSVSEMSAMMDVPVNKLIATCMSLGLFVSINQRLDAETMALVADEYGFSVEFVSAEVLNEIEEEVDAEEDLLPRPPIVTVMGHVDHGKTRLLDRIRNTNIIDGEAGGITQHIGAYSVKLAGGKQITFLDTPGHEAFTAMRARGAQITDVAIIIIAADDSVMPQTVEAINHASAAGVPMVFAINKIDKSTANPEKIREALANMNYLVEDWGGKYQCQEISAKAGINIEDLLEKVILEADILELKANPDKNAVGTVIEASLDKGRGFVTTLLVQSGTLKVGDILLAGCQTGRVKAMYNERGHRVEEAGPSTPVLVLGLNGAPQAGDKFNVMESDHEARNVANKRIQLQREQGLRTQKHITLDEIGRRLALGNFNEINLIVKGDVDGSVEALSDSLIKLSTDSFAVNIIHKAVGQISESDVMLATASNAIIVGFQVRPSSYARRLAETEEIEIRLYSVIYDAIEEIKDAMEGMLSPTIKETITGSCEIREVFKITKVGSVAGCLVTDGKIYRKSKIRLIRDGIVIYTGELGSLKRFKDDAKEVVSGLECGLNIDKFNDIKVGDIIEAFDETEVKQTL
ncbi:MAG: translation initiation factor IF-2 [Bacteroidales bacterium]|nr:translation initiation factor IF-2 [Bacteroidales bacterium]MCK9498661.1 translation initiation factor IF-2 [Bacteroidales bacterium]